MEPSKLRNFMNTLLAVPTLDPDDARRGKLLNILLAGVVVLSVLALLVTAFFFIFIPNLGGSDREGVLLILYSGLALLVGSVIFYLTNRFVSGTLASIMFLLFMLTVLSFSDTPLELAAGRSLFVYTIPVVMASVLLRPASSFIFAGLSALVVFILGRISNSEPNQIAMIGYFFLAIISWLSARSLEQTLAELRTINTELDQRVANRTHELSESLEREQVEAGRREAILNSIADGVIVFDRNGKAILANPSITALVGKRPEAIIGTNVYELLNSEGLDPNSRGRIAALFEQTAALTTPHIRVAWGNKTLSLNAAEVKDTQNQTIGTVAVFRDYTHDAELERMKDTFMAIVSHELRTPLNAIIGYAELLIEAVYGEINEKQKNATQRIMSNSQRLLAIVNDLLDQAQIESGKLKIQTVACKPAELIDNLRSVMDKIVTDKGLTLTTTIDPAMPASVTGDPARLQQVMVNLVNNAVKFTDKGGIDVGILRSAEAHWQIKITDTGRGLSKDALGYIFEPFRQVESASTRQRGGVGLGLSIVKQLVQLMKGNIEVQSQLEVGSTFTVTLPIILPEE